MAMDFEARRNKGGNLFLSYTVQEDHVAASHGYAFLGVAHDERGTEVHVFQMQSLEDLKTD